jgi:hypothetical protein
MLVDSSTVYFLTNGKRVRIDVYMNALTLIANQKGKAKL